jgi:hypothetical protein
MHDGRFTNLVQVMRFYAGTAPTADGTKVAERERTLDLIPHLTPAQQLDLVEFPRTLSSPPLPLALTRPPPHP